MFEGTIRGSDHPPKKSRVKSPVISREVFRTEIRPSDRGGGLRDPESGYPRTSGPEISKSTIPE